MKKNFKLTENDLNRLVKKIISEQATTTTTQATQPLMNEDAVKNCMDATYGKGRGFGKNEQGALIYSVGGLVTFFFLNGRYFQEYNKTKGSFNCSTGKAILTPDTSGIKPTTKTTSPTTKPTAPTAKTTAPTAKTTAKTTAPTTVTTGEG